MKILITGTDGFIGSNLNFFLELNNNTILKINEDFTHKKDWQINLVTSLNNFIPDVVFHVGACSDTLNTDVQYMMTLNFEFTKILADWCSNYKIPLIYSSSAANYGSDGNIPSNLYAWSKYVSECYVNSKNGISLRYFNVYGPGEEKKGKMSSIIYQAIVHKNNNNETFKLFPKKPERDFIYVEDVINANIYALNNFEKLKGKYYDVGSGKSEPFEKILEIIGLNFHYVNESDIPNGYQFYTCSDKKKWMEGWEPKYDLTLGIKKFLKIKKDEKTKFSF